MSYVFFVGPESCMLKLLNRLESALEVLKSCPGGTFQDIIESRILNKHPDQQNGNYCPGHNLQRAAAHIWCSDFLPPGNPVRLTLN